MKRSSRHSEIVLTTKVSPRPMCPLQVSSPGTRFHVGGAVVGPVEWDNKNMG